MATPKGYERARLIEAYYNKTNKGRVGSAPFTPENLYTSKGKIKNEQFNWLYLSVWLGLRPQEIDNLKNKVLWNIEENCNPKILWVFQTKIVSLPHEDRWKPIVGLINLKLKDILHFTILSVVRKCVMLLVL